MFTVGHRFVDIISEAIRDICNEVKMNRTACRNRACWLLLIVAALSQVSRAAAFDVEGFNKLPEDQRRTFVTEAIASRDAALRNLEYKADVVIENVRLKDGASRFMTRSAHVFR